MSHAPVIHDLALVRRAENIVAEYAASRVQIIADRPGNPFDAQIRRYGAAIALRAPVFGEHFFNRALGFDDDSLDAAREAIDWYAEQNVPAVFEVLPGLPTGRLMAELADRGYRHVSYHATYAGPSELASSPSPGVEVRRVASEADLAAFSEAYHVGWGHTGPRVPMKPWLEVSGWRLYLGLCDGVPSGAAVLYIRGQTGYLADGAVDPRWRNRGVHRALLDARCAEAAAAGCSEIVSGADYLSGSSRNMLRKGLTLLMTKALWRAPATP